MSLTTQQTPIIEVDAHLVSEVATALDLRAPNRDALATLALELFNSQQRGDESPELVFDLATGVGKTYLMAGAIRYLVECGVRNFVVFVPRLAIRQKTLNNLTPGHRKSVGDGLPELTLITNEDLDKQSTITAMENPDEVKVYVLTVQTVAGRDSEVRRRAHTFQETLGVAFYERLQELDDLVVFADEHHTYNGPAFSKAVRDLRPMALLGLTATPDETHTTPEQIVFRYPLPEAVADGYVKRPVIVGRSDELTDTRTRLHDGVKLLRAKQSLADQYVRQTGAAHRNLLMLVVAKSIAEAEQVEELLTEPTFFDGQYQGRVLRVDSGQPEEALEALEQVEHPDSPHRIVVSVQMLKEGWDVATVSVIASLRPEVSELLTEQTLGRGLRLPWGRWVNGEFEDADLLNTLDIVAHASYEKLLAQARSVKHRRIDRAAWFRDKTEHIEADAEGRSRIAEAFGSIVANPQDGLAGPTGPTGAPTAGCGGGSAVPPDTEAEPSSGNDAPPIEIDTNFDGRVQRGQEQSNTGELLYPRRDVSLPRIPVYEVKASPTGYASLQTIFTEGKQQLRELGLQFRRDPQAILRRTELEGDKTTGPQGMVSGYKVRHQTQTIRSDAKPPPTQEARKKLIADVMGSRYATGTLSDLTMAEQIVDEFIEAAGSQAAQLGAYQQEVSNDLLSLMNRVVRNYSPPYEETAYAYHRDIAKARRPAQETSDDLFGPFKRGVGYTGWQRHLYEQARFDSEPERAAAIAIDSSDEVVVWVRLERGDLPVAWTGTHGQGANYNPDFLVIEREHASAKGPLLRCRLVEVKSDRDDDTAEVEAKHRAATYWANQTNSLPDRQGQRWSVLRITETDLQHARGVWSNLKGRGKEAP